MNHFLVIVYWLIAVYFFTRWLDFFNKDAFMSNKEKLQSRMILIIATVCWPIVVPLSYSELLNAKKTERLRRDRVRLSSR